MLPTIGFIACLISSIIGSLIKMERIFSLTRLFINLKTCLQIENLKGFYL
jgi:hypothetical protein